MSRHPLDPLSLGSGLLFLAMSLAGLAAAAGVTGDAVAVTAICGVLAVGLVGLAVTARRLAMPDDRPGGAAGVPGPTPDPTEPQPMDPGLLDDQPTVRGPADPASTALDPEPGLEPTKPGTHPAPAQPDTG